MQVFFGLNFGWVLGIALGIENLGMKKGLTNHS